jgi:hypothetical protein
MPDRSSPLPAGLPWGRPGDRSARSTIWVACAFPARAEDAVPRGREMLAGIPSVYALPRTEPFGSRSLMPHFGGKKS